MIYFISNGSDAVKIGYSLRVEERIKELQNGSPFPLEILALSPGDKVAEREYHQKYSDLAIGGEWFQIDKSLEGEIKQLKGLYGIDPFEVEDIIPPRKGSTVTISVQLIPGQDDRLIEFLSQPHVNQSAAIRAGLNLYIDDIERAERRPDFETEVLKRLDELLSHNGGGGASPPKKSNPFLDASP